MWDWFAAMENDYFPRLSATHDVQQTNEIVNRQMEILLLLLAPLLSVMILGLPWIIRLLLSADFLPIVSMAQIAAVAMVLKAATLPVAYLTLARGRSLAYLVLETTYFLAFVLLVMWCYRQWGLRFPVRTLYITGAALAMVSTALCISMFFLVD